MLDNALSPREVAKRLEVSYPVVHKWLHQGFFKTGRRLPGSHWVWIIDEADLTDPFILEKVAFAKQHGKLITQGREIKRKLREVP